MEAVAIPKKRKVIDIPENVFKSLSIQAAANGTNLKRYIEMLLIREVINIDDSEAYRKLMVSDPNGLLPANEKEQQAFRNWLGI